MVSFSIFISFKVIKNICAKLFLITAELIIKFVDKNISYHRLKERCYNLLIKRINTTNFNQRHMLKDFCFKVFIKDFFAKYFYFFLNLNVALWFCTARSVREIDLMVLMNLYSPSVFLLLILYVGEYLGGGPSCLQGRLHWEMDFTPHNYGMALL